MEEDTVEKIKKFFDKYPLVEYKSGQILIFSGDKASHIFLIKKGRIKISEVNYRGDELILHMFHPPIFIPMALVVNDRASPYIYQADSDVIVRKAPAEDTLQFVKDNPDVLYALLRRMYSGSDILLDRIAHLMSSDAKTRLKFEILTFGRYHGLLEGKRCTISLRERELAARTGLSRETVSREIKKLAEKGIIERNGSTIVIPDIDQMEKIVSPNLYPQIS